MAEKFQNKKKLKKQTIWSPDQTDHLIKLITALYAIPETLDWTSL